MPRWSLYVLIIQFFMLSVATADTIKIGLRAHSGIEKSMLQWKLTADYLSKKIPEHKFVMVPIVGLGEILQAAENNQFDFVLSNPSSYVEMEQRFGASAILTLRNKRQGKPYSRFGSVIFVRKDSNINEIKDLEGKNIIAVSERAFGGWQVALRELLREGFDIENKAKQISFSGGVQQNVVSIVRSGNADVGIVRTDMLERLAQSGEISLDDFKVINKKSSAEFPFYHSTQLYPEWAFAKMRNTSTELSKKIALELLTIEASHPAAMAGKYVGWTVPEDYQPVHNLMKDLKVGPYEHFHENEFDHFVEQYLIHFIISIFVFVTIILSSLYILKLNRKLHEAKDELEQRVEERTSDLLIAKDVAEKANMAKSEFLSNMSHELRTPLNAVLGFAQLIELESKQQQLDVVKDNAKEILTAGRHLLELVNDILDLTKIETGKYELELEKISVNKSLVDVLHLLGTQAESRQVTILSDMDTASSVNVLADQRSLKQILINIISNAIKYNHPGGNINIEVENKEDGFCCIKVTDNGDGIDENKLELIFDPFQRLTNRTNLEGSGVGLSITKKLVEAMGGQILVESKLGHGSTFSVFLKQAT